MPRQSSAPQADAILLAAGGAQAELYASLLRARFGAQRVRVWPHAGEPLSDIGYACLWNAPHGLPARCPHLKAIFNLGAGADHLLADPELPEVPVVRAVHRDLSMRVTEYVVLHVLMFHRRQRRYDEQQRAAVWQAHAQPGAGEVAVGIMGLGHIGQHAAGVLRALGFRVAGWSRTPKRVPGIEVHHAAGGLDAFLARTEILVCLLPATPQTHGLLDLALLRKLRRDGAAGGACLINAGRGRVQVDADIIAALDEGALVGAALDVFPVEPLPADSPLWRHPRVTVTPHNAGDIAPEILIEEVARQIARCERGLPLEYTIDRARGY